MPSFVEIGPVVMEKKLKKVRSFQTDGQTDGQGDGRTTGDQKSSLELSAQVS